MGGGRGGLSGCSLLLVLLGNFSIRSFITSFGLLYICYRKILLAKLLDPEARFHLCR